MLPNAARLPDGTLLCDPEALATLARVEPAQARVLFFAFEEAGLVRRGPDCTLEATILLNQPLDTVLAALPDATAQRLATTLFRAVRAAQDRQATYRAVDFAVATGVDPRLVDPLLVRLAERDLLLYRAYSRGITVMTAPALEDREGLTVVARQFATRYERFEERLQTMLDYVTLRPGQGRCRSAYLVHYLTGGVNAPRCGRCDLCSPTAEHVWQGTTWRSSMKKHAWSRSRRSPSYGVAWVSRIGAPSRLS